MFQNYLVYCYMVCLFGLVVSQYQSCALTEITNSPAGSSPTVVDISGSYAVAGYPTVSNNTGMAIVYYFNSSSVWQQVLEVYGNQPGDLLGSAVAINQDSKVLFIGAPGSLESKGVVFQYQIVNDVGWSRINLWKGLEAGNLFGSSIATTDSVAVVGAPKANAGLGRVSVIRASKVQGPVLEPVWNLAQHIEGVTANTDFGYSVSISNSGSTIGVGAPNLSLKSPGNAFIFSYNSGSKQFKLLDSMKGETNGDLFGYSVGVYGSSDGSQVGMIIGVPNKSQASLYEWSSSIRTLNETFTGPNLFGMSVGIDRTYSGGVALPVIGAPSNSNALGAAYALTESNGSWLLGNSVSGTTPSFGSFISVSTGTAAIGDNSATLSLWCTNE